MCIFEIVLGIILVFLGYYFIPLKSPKPFLGVYRRPGKRFTNKLAFSQKKHALPIHFFLQRNIAKKCFIDFAWQQSYHSYITNANNVSYTLLLWRSTYNIYLSYHTSRVKITYRAMSAFLFVRTKKVSQASCQIKHVL